MVVDFEFKKKIMDYHVDSGLIRYCYQCNRCTDNCPISYATDDLYTKAYNPRLNILNTLLGYKDAILNADTIVIWGCTSCDTCNEVCPQHIKLTEIFILLKNETVKQGKAPEKIYTQAGVIFKNGKAIPSQSAIERRRKSLGLPAVMEPDVNEIQNLMKNVDADKKLR
ncbi:MAG: 4Fe-4S dicluster domain-containing protein [Candidatus Odinarchaeota archaeon]